MEAQVTELTSDDILDPPISNADSPTVSGPFKPGYDPRRNAHGRPKKGDTFAERYVRAVQKDSKALIRKHIERAKGDGVVASREFALAAAYVMGRPVQPYVNVGGDDPLTALVERMAARRQLLPPQDDSYVEADVLPTSDDKT